MYYECKRCNYVTTKKCDITRHLNRKIICIRNVNSYKYNDDELVKLSLIPIKEKKEIPDRIKLNFRTEEELLEYINKNNINFCLFCNKQYNRKYDLNRHITSSCKKKCFNKEIINNNQPIIQNFNNFNNIQNINIHVYNIQNNIIPFDEQWDTTKISNVKKLDLFLSNDKYSNTLKEILTYQNNLNVIFDKENDTGLIYKNDNEKFQSMKSEDIIEKTMCKIYKHLIDFHKDIKTNETYSNIDNHINIVKDKLNTFNKSIDIKEKVKDIMISIFDKEKDKVIEKFLIFDKLILNIENNEDSIGY